MQLSLTTTPDTRLLTVSGNVVQASVTSGVGSIAGVVQQTVGVIAADNVQLYVDSLSVGTPDTSATLPATATTINIGQNSGASDQPFGPIRNITIAPSPWSASRIAQ